MADLPTTHLPAIAERPVSANTSQGESCGSVGEEA
jgi:hypothetical protein